MQHEYKSHINHAKYAHYATAVRSHMYIAYLIVCMSDSCIVSYLQVINLVIILLYRFGYAGDFLGVGGTWNLNEEKNADAEIIASGVFVGFFVYTGVQILAFLFGTTAHKR